MAPCTPAALPCVAGRSIYTATEESARHAATAYISSLTACSGQPRNLARPWSPACTHDVAEVARPWSFRRPPRPPPVRRSVAPWEKDFCESCGVPWRKVTDRYAGLNAEGPDGRVARWDDSGAVEALLAAKKRYWAEINGGLKAAVPPLPNPDMYIDVIVEDDDDDGVVRPEVEAEYAAAVRDMERAREESARLHAAMLRDDFVPVPTGWDV